MAVLVTRKTKSSILFERIADNDQTAVDDCFDTYGNFIWALARKFTASTEEAEAAAQVIFIDIWRYSESADQSHSAENILIALMARRRLIKHLQ